ncbi:hypothetical protein SAMN05216601_11171 [Ectopseudomonas composti]|uniref:Uncharacterized protein n=1 Tax=Ectopseudomonas composti TaxID=658457 RepID=A0A1I5QA25_9GAMM|nr:hypothetical protein [Pseudomonas composti]SFP42696.1 hypothetical protein SAMN05216601_11171 [Pseudomonas composti]
MSPQDLQTASSIIGMIGGILGLIVFLDTYALKFKPEIIISTKLYFKYRTDTKHEILKNVDLESVVIKIEIINKRAKSGRIDDFAIRIYDSSSISPTPLMLYAENTLSDTPIKSSPTLLNITPFSPISVLAKTSKTVVVEFKPEKYLSAIIDPQGSTRLELLSYTTESGWKSTPTYSPHFFLPYNEEFPDDGLIELSLFDSDLIRKKASTPLPKPKTSVYEGLSDKEIQFKIRKPYYMILSLSSKQRKLAKLTIEAIKLFSREAFIKYITWPILQRKSSKTPRFSISNANAHLSKDTSNALTTCKENLTLLASRINKTAEPRASITITDNDSQGFTISRANRSLKFYKSGDGIIRIEETSGYPKKNSFELRLIEYPFGFRLWQLNKKTMTLKAACITVIDLLVLIAY